MKACFNTFFSAIIFLTIFLLYGENAVSQLTPGYKSGTLFYYFHTIKKNETLGQIALMYNVTVNEILEVNITISNQEKVVEGQKIKVPNYSNFIDKYPHDQWTFLLYRVKQGDKLKNIAKEFKTDTDDIKNINPGIENKPVVGSEIRVPIPKQGVAQVQKPDKKDDKKEKTESGKNSNANDKASKNPALTFNWGNKENNIKENINDIKESINNNNANIQPEEDNNREKIRDTETNCIEYTYKSGTIFNVSIIATLEKDDGKNDFNGVSFLRGALIAANKMKSNGLSLKLNTFDAGKKNSIDRILQQSNLKESNIIIAATPLNDLYKLAAYAKENKIHLIIPNESKAFALVENNPYVIQLHPSDNAIYRKLTSKQYVSAEISPILVKPEKPDSLMLENFRAAMKKQFGTFNEQKHVLGLRYLDIKDNLNENKHNLIFVCSNSEPFISDLLNRLHLVNYRISVYGRDKWRDFNLIDKSLYFDMNLHLVQPMFVDYNNNEAKLFVQLYRKAYNNEPGGYAFLGYDVLYYFLTTLKKYGPSFQNCISDFNFVSLQSQYRLKRNVISDGFVNDGCFLLEYTPDSIEIKRE
jgi:LysM repeat protein